MCGGTCFDTPAGLHLEENLAASYSGISDEERECDAFYHLPVTTVKVSLSFSSIFIWNICICTDAEYPQVCSVKHPHTLVPFFSPLSKTKSLIKPMTSLTCGSWKSTVHQGFWALFLVIPFDVFKFLWCISSVRQSSIKELWPCESGHDLLQTPLHSLLNCNYTSLCDMIRL